MNRGVWQATVHRVAKSQTWLKRLSTLPICINVHMHSHEVVFLTSMPITEKAYTNPLFYLSIYQKTASRNKWWWAKNRKPRSSSFPVKVFQAFILSLLLVAFAGASLLWAVSWWILLSHCLFYFKLVSEHKAETPETAARTLACIEQLLDSVTSLSHLFTGWMTLSSGPVFTEGLY